MKYIFAFALSLLFFSCGNSSEEKEFQDRIDSLQAEISELQQANDTLSDHLLKKAHLTRNYPAYFTSIPQPEDYLLEKLRENSDLIQRQAVLGGTMRFTGVEFINDELVVAEYEDGHVLGKGIFRYSITGNGEIDFELLATLDY